jgi:hypothetical protein
MLLRFAACVEAIAASTLARVCPASKVTLTVFLIVQKVNPVALRQDGPGGGGGGVGEAATIETVLQENQLLLENT